MHFLERIHGLLEIWEYDADVDFLPSTHEEFEKKKAQRGIVNQSVKEGVIILSKK